MCTGSDCKCHFPGLAGNAAGMYSMKHGGKSRAESRLKHFTKKLTVSSLYLTDNPLHWKNSTYFFRDKHLLYTEKSLVR